MALQHLHSSTANKRPTPGAMSVGQLAINLNTASPGLFFKDSAGALIKVGPVHVGTTAPNASPASGGETGNTVGEQWLDTTGGTYVFKVWDGSAWRSESGTFVDVNGDVMTGALGIIAGSAGSPGLYFSGDTNTGLYSPGSDQLALATGGTGRLFVDSSGRAGIGTASPSSRLHVLNLSAGPEVFTIERDNSGVFLKLYRNAGSGNPGGLIGADSAGTYFAGGTSTAEMLYIDPSNSVMQFYTSGSERARIDSSGRLLVGTSSQSGGSLLQVNGDRIRIATAKTPASATDTGVAGEICWDANYIYVCTATNTWKRSALSTW